MVKLIYLLRTDFKNQSTFYWFFFEFQTGNFNKYWKKMKQVCNATDLTCYEGQFAALFCGNLLSAMKQHQEKGIEFQAVSYHQLKDRTDEEMVRIREFCEIDQNRVCRLPERDTQNNSGLSREALRSYHQENSPEQLEVIDKVLELSGFPACEKFPLDAETFAEILGLKGAESIIKRNEETDQALPTANLHHTISIS